MTGRPRQCRTWIAALAVVFPGTQETSPPAADLDVTVHLEESVVHARPDEALVRTLTVQLVAPGAAGARGRVEVGPLAVQSPTAARPPQPVQARGDEQEFSLRRGEQRRLEFSVPVPAATSGSAFVLPVRVRAAPASGRRPGPTDPPEPLVHEQELLLARAPAWRVVGPFSNTGREGFDRSYGPEIARRPEGSYRLAETQVSWQPLLATALRPDGMIDLARQHEGNDDELVHYAWIDVRAERRTDAVLLVGSDDTITVWQDGRKIHEHEVYRAAAPGQDRIEVRLERGEQPFLVKVCNGDGGYGFYFELQDEAGRLPDGVTLPTVVRSSGPTEPELRVIATTSGGATLRWHTPEPRPSMVRLTRAVQGRTDPRIGLADHSAMVVALQDAPTLTLRDDRYRTTHEVLAAGLEPATRYLVELDRDELSPERIVFFTDPEPGRTLVLRLRLAALVFSHVVEEDPAVAVTGERPEPKRLELEQLARLHREMQQVVLFYWLNSGLRLHLDVELFEDPTPRTVRPGTPYGLTYSGTEYDALDRVLARHGLEGADFDGVLLISADQYHDGAAGRWRLRGSGGGTLGPLPPYGIGKSGWKAGSDAAWLFCHEFHHQLDALYQESGWPEFLFNHFQPWDDTAHRHGEHWDGNAWTLSEWGGHRTREQPDRWQPGMLGFRFFVSRFGEVVAVIDADGDGIPDDAPHLPLDERRFGSRPDLPDSDGDGLDDLAEAMATQGVDLGLGERWARGPAVHRLSPTEPDSDGDGLLDGEDPAPLYPFAVSVPRTVASGEVTAPRWLPWARLAEPDCELDVALAWSTEQLLVKLEAPRPPARLRICLDADDDGWYVGGDNLDLWLTPAGGARPSPDWHANDEGTLRFSRNHCGIPGRWPFYEAAALNLDAAAVQQATADGGRWSAELALRRSPTTGLELAPGEQVGLRIVAWPGDSADRGYSLLEPHTFFSLTLGAED